jgi:hypothetical protein
VRDGGGVPGASVFESVPECAIATRKKEEKKKERARVWEQKSYAVSRAISLRIFLFLVVSSSFPPG